MSQKLNYLFKRKSKQLYILHLGCKEVEYLIWQCKQVLDTSSSNITNVLGVLEYYINNHCSETITANYLIQEKLKKSIKTKFKSYQDEC